ncbi:MAG: 1-acyl-sn-glycerol-3-phosphate acyltransferase [Marmoricola sp.]|nr:1-acyl-sn-glycerol-3-phosphate acyltransferase [Marmoricola sp.]
MRDLTYPPVIVTAKALFRVLGLRFQMQGTEHVPRQGGALLAFNHVSYIDFVLGGLAAQPSKRLVRFMAKREVFDHAVAGPVMRSMHHISVDRADGNASLEVALRYLQEGEVVGIFPEATISRSFEVKELKTGATRIAAQAGVPLVPVVLWGTQRMMTKDHPRNFSRGKTIGIRVGEPMHPTGADPAKETVELHDRLSALLDLAIDAYPADEQPPGSWWLPASRGGSAPTPERAAELDAEEKAARAARKAARGEPGPASQDDDPAVG